MPSGYQVLRVVSGLFHKQSRLVAWVQRRSSERFQVATEKRNPCINGAHVAWVQHPNSREFSNRCRISGTRAQQNTLVAWVQRRSSERSRFATEERNPCVCEIGPRCSTGSASQRHAKGARFFALLPCHDIWPTQTKQIRGMGAASKFRLFLNCGRVPDGGVRGAFRLSHDITSLQLSPRGRRFWSRASLRWPWGPAFLRLAIHRAAPSGSRRRAGLHCRHWGRFG